MRYIFGVTDSQFNVPQADVTNATFTSILQIVFGLAGGLALIVLILAGLKYVISRGDPAGVAKAKNTIVYAVIGLAVAAGAFSIVTFVVKSV